MAIQVNTFFPFLDWFNHYSSKHLKGDIAGGLTVALVLIPQSMAYAQLAGLPAYYGLYAAFLPPIVASLFGSSRQLATGPVSVVSLMTAVALEPIATSGGANYIAYAILLAFLVGVFQFILGVLRLGLLVNFLSHPVVNGFTNAAAIIIATSQLSKIFGVYVDKGENHFMMIVQVLRSAVYYTHWPTLLLGLLAFVIMFSLKRIAPKVPNILVAVVITTLISWATGFENKGSTRIEDIKSADARRAISEFNFAINSLDKITAERADLNRKLANVKLTGNRIAISKALHDLDIATIKIDEIIEQITLLRIEIRGFLFEGEIGSENRLKILPKGHFSNQQESDGRIWRIKVKNSRLPVDRLPLCSGGEVVGNIPAGLPDFALPGSGYGVITYLLPFAVIISLLGFMEAISISKAMAAETGQRIDPNQELIGQGLGNIFGSFAGSYSTSGSFSRSAINLQSGAYSGLSNVFSGIAVVTTLIFFTPLLYHLPQSVLAAIIMMAVIGLINLRGFLHTWRAKKHDGIILVITFIGTLGFAPHLDRGIFIGVVLSIGVFLFRSMRPRVVDLSLGLDRALHDCESYGLQECRYIDVVRFDGPLFFANASYLEEQIRNRRKSNKDLKHIIIVANGINDIDASGEEVLSLIVDRIRSARIGISMSGVNEVVADVLKRTHLLAKIGKENLYSNLNNAIAAVHDSTHRGGDEKDCPLMTVVKNDECVIQME